MNEDIRKLSKKTDEVVHRFLQELEHDAIDMNLTGNPTLWFAYMTNTALMALAVAVECQARRLPYSGLLLKAKSEEDRAELNQAFRRNAGLISDFYFREITQKRAPESIQVKIEEDPDEKGKES